MSIAQAQAAGWLFQPPAAAPLIVALAAEALADFPWRSLSLLVGDLLAVMFVTVISLLLNATGVEIATRREADIERELNALGLASLVEPPRSAAMSAPCRSAVPRSTTRSAASSRLSGLTVAAISALMLVVDPGFLGFVPKFALGGLLFFAGARLLHRWIVQSARQLTPLEYVSLLAVALIIVQWGFIAGVLIGVVIGCATFAVSASRVNAIKFSFDGSEYRSRLDRSAEELAILAQHGRELQGMSLQSYLFFGSANRLYQHVKALLRERPEMPLPGVRFPPGHRHRFVGDAQLLADQAGGRRNAAPGSCWSISKPELATRLPAIRLLSPDVIVAADLDRALESCEDAIIAAHRGESGELDSLRGWLGKALGSAEHADALAALCHRFEVGPGDIVARQGEPSNSMHFILDGRVGIVVDMGDGHAVRVRSLGRHTTIGEMGLISGRPRSATIQAEAPSVLYELSLERFNELQARAARARAGALELCDCGDGRAPEFRQPRDRRITTLIILRSRGGSAGFRAIDSRRKAGRKRQFAFSGDPLMFFGDILDAVARIARISLRGRDEMANFIGPRRGRSKHPRFELDDLTDIEPVSHEIILLSFVGADAGHPIWGRSSRIATILPRFGARTIIIAPSMP